MPGGKQLISLSLSAVLIAGMVSVTGCGYRDGNRNVSTNSTRYGAKTLDMNRVNRYGVNSTSRDGLMDGSANGRSENLRVSKELSQRISEMSEVRNATVMLRNNDAYVAVNTNNMGANGVRGLNSTRGMNGTNGMNGTRGMNGTNGMNGTRGMNGVNERTTDLGGPRVYTNTPNTTGVPLIGERNMVGGNTGYGPADHGMDMTSRTGVLGMMRGATANPNAGVRDYGMTNRAGVHTYNTNTAAAELPQQLKNKIANKVKQFAPEIENVYVSADPHFTQRMSTFARDMENGHPVRAITDEFRVMTERLFPTPAGTTHPNGTVNGTQGMRGNTVR